MAEFHSGSSMQTSVQQQHVVENGLQSSDDAFLQQELTVHLNCD